MCFSSISSEQMDEFCIYIDKFKIHVISNARYFCSTFNRVMALDRRQNFFMLNIMWINLWILIKFGVCIDTEDLNDRTVFFVHFQQSYGSWFILKFHLCSISCGPTDGLIKFCQQVKTHYDQWKTCSLPLHLTAQEVLCFSWEVWKHFDQCKTWSLPLRLTACSMSQLTSENTLWPIKNMQLTSKWQLSR